MKSLKIFLIQIIFLNFIYANIGGAIANPSIIGSPVLFTKSDLSISSINLELSLMQFDSSFVCNFNTKYNLEGMNSLKYDILGIFYGLRTRNVKIQSNNLELNRNINKNNIEKLDALFFEKPLKYFNAPKDEFDKTPLSRYGFDYRVNNNSKNEITVNGELIPQKTKYWGLAAMSFVNFRHPYFIKDVIPENYRFQYLMKPISSWNSVQNINVIFNYPKNFKLYSNIFNYSLDEYGIKIKPEIQDSTKQITFKLGSKYPEIISFSVEKKSKLFYLGGPYLSLGNIEGSGIILNFSWETAINIYNYNAIFFALGYETNFNDHASLVPNFHLNTVFLNLFGINMGMPYDLKNKSINRRLGFSFDLSIFSISFDWDYITENKKWKKYFHINFTI